MIEKRTRILGLGAAAMTMILAFGGSEAMAQRYRSMSCGELWYARNAIYADAGYCFESRRAIRTFGRGCFPPYGKLRPVERRQVEAIKRWERRKGCR